MVILGGICHKCNKFYEGSWCGNCEKVNVEKTLNFINDFHDSYYDNGLGTVVKSRQHRKQLMKEKGLEEVGNEWKYVDPARAAKKREEKIAKDFEEAKKEAHKMWRD